MCLGTHWYTPSASRYLEEILKVWLLEWQEKTTLNENKQTPHRIKSGEDYRPQREFLCLPRRRALGHTFSDHFFTGLLPCLPCQRGRGKTWSPVVFCAGVQGRLGNRSLGHSPSLPQTNSRFDHTSKHCSVHPHYKSLFPPPRTGPRGDPTEVTFA